MTGSPGRTTRAERGGRAPAAPRALPRLLLLTDRHQAATPLADVVAAAVEAGVRAVVLREKDLPWEDRAGLAAALGPVVHGAGGLLLGADAALPGCDGVHLPTGARTATPSWGLVGRSCHDHRELRAAGSDRTDYVTVSPVYPSRSKPGYGPALGVDGLARLAGATDLPVYALGGVETVAAVRACGRAGAAGVAVMGAVMRAARPELVSAELVAAIEERVS